MVEITFEKDGPAVPVEVGYASFAAIPLKSQKDFGCSPPGVISWQEAQDIAAQLSRDVVVGRVRDMQWKG